MSFGYIIREGISGFQRAKLAAVGSILTVTISLLLLGIFYVISANTSRIIDAVRARVEMEAFLQEPISAQRINEIRRLVASFDGVEKVAFVSKEEAAKIFKQEFGEDINAVLDFNPLPPSLKITLRDEARTPARAEVITKKIKTIQGVDDVIYRKDLLEFLDKRSKMLDSLALALGLLIGLSAVFLVSNTIRLTIFAKRKAIHAMKLVGASRAFVRAPFLIEGIIQGSLGGLIAAAILYYIVSFAAALISADLADFIKIDPLFYLATIGFGAMLGLIGSAISVRKFIGDVAIP